MAQMKITKSLIVGGAGFIGSHLVDVCLKNGLQVCVYDNFSTGQRSFLPNVPELRVVEGDILDSKQLLETIQAFDPDIVFHLAAIHHIPTCEKNPAKTLSTNIVGTESVLSACAVNRVPRIVFTSTGALYDPVITGLLAETVPVKAFDIYSISKLTCEFLIKYYVEKSEREVIVARLFNNVGRRETNSHLIPALVAQLAAGNRQIRLGNLSPRRDYIHVEDVAEALYALGIMELQQPFDIFNVGTGIEYSVQELVELFADVIGEPLEVISAPELQRKVDRPSQQADSAKLKNTTGWRPTRSLRQALGEIWQESLSKLQ
jgi:UDP-glucose 4-epimerase